MSSDNEKQPESQSGKHRQDVLFTILLPVLLVAAGVIVLLLLLLLNSADNTVSIGIWAQISLIFLILPWFLVGFVLLAAMVITSKLLSGFQEYVLPWLQAIKGFSSQAKNSVDQLTSNTASPMVIIMSAKAGIIRLFQLAFRKG